MGASFLLRNQIYAQNWKTPTTKKNKNNLLWVFNIIQCYSMSARCRGADRAEKLIRQTLHTPQPPTIPIDSFIANHKLAIVYLFGAAGLSFTSYNDSVFSLAANLACASRFGIRIPMQKYLSDLWATDARHAILLFAPFAFCTGIFCMRPRALQPNENWSHHHRHFSNGATFRDRTRNVRGIKVAEELSENT